MQLTTKEAILFYITAILLVGAWILYIDGVIAAQHTNEVEQWHVVPGLLTTLGFCSISVTPASVLFNQVSNSLLVRGSTEHIRMWILSALTCSILGIVIVLQTFQTPLHDVNTPSTPSIYTIARILQPFLILASTIVLVWRKYIVLQIHEEF